MQKLEKKIYSDKFKGILVRQFKAYGVPRISKIVVDQVMTKFDDHLIGVSTLDDPTAPEHFRDRFEEMLYNNIKDGMVISNNKVLFSIGDKDRLGYSGLTDDPMSTMVYILEGILGEYAFIPASIIKTRFRNEAVTGHYSGGYLVSASNFYKKGWDKFISWDKARWGFSNKGPIDIFTLDQAPIVKAISDTISRACEEFSAILRANNGV